MNNTILKDLQTDNAFILMTTLTMFRYFATPLLLQSALPALMKLTTNTTSIVRRKAYLAVMDIQRQYPETKIDIATLGLQALQDQETPVVFAGISMLNPLVRANPHLFREHTKKIAYLLGQIIDHRFPKEYDYHRMPAPWMQISLLQML